MGKLYRSIELNLLHTIKKKLAYVHGYLLAWPANYGSHFRTVLVYGTWFCDIIVKLSGKFIAKHLIDK